MHVKPKTKLRLRNYSLKLSQSIPDNSSIIEDCLQCTKINCQTQILLKKNHSFILNNILTTVPSQSHQQQQASNISKSFLNQKDCSIPYEHELNLMLLNSKAKKKLPIVPRYPFIPKPATNQQYDSGNNNNNKGLLPVKSSLPFNNQMIKNAFKKQRPSNKKRVNVSTIVPTINAKINIAKVMKKDPSMKGMYSNKLNKRLIQFFQLIYQKPLECNMRTKSEEWQ